MKFFVACDAPEMRAVYRLAEQLRTRPRDSLLDVRPAEGGVVIKATGAVGLVRFTNFEVRIEPKLPGNHLQLFRMVEFATGFCRHARPLVPLRREITRIGRIQYRSGNLSARITAHKIVSKLNTLRLRLG